MVRYQILADAIEQVFSASIQNIGIQVFEVGEKVTVTFSEENAHIVLI